MKIGMRKPSLKKSISARTTGAVKRKVKSTVNPFYGKKGVGWIKNPKRAAYNKVYRKFTFGLPFLFRLFSKNKIPKTTDTNITEYTNMSTNKSPKKLKKILLYIFLTLLVIGIIGNISKKKDTKNPLPETTVIASIDNTTTSENIQTSTTEKIIISSEVITTKSTTTTSTVEQISTTDLTTNTTENITTTSPTTTTISTTQSIAPSSEIKVNSFSNIVTRNQVVTLTIQGEPNTKYRINVFYSTKASEAEGLEDKISDQYGNISWTWKIGGRTKPGDYKILIQALDSNQKLEMTFTVIE